MSALTPADAVAAEADPLGVHPCARCGRAFSRERYLALHEGREHEDALTAAERARFEAAVAAEDAWLARFRRHVRAALNTLPVAIIFLFILLLVGISGINIFFGLLLLPGAIGFGALIYALTYSRAEAVTDPDPPTAATGNVKRQKPARADVSQEPDAARAMSEDEALAYARERVGSVAVTEKGRVDEGDFGEPSYWLSMTLTQLDADAMNDRLQAFIKREVEEALPGATALVDYHHARPHSPGPGSLDVEDVWHDVRPTFRIDPSLHLVTRDDVDRWIRFIPRFHQVVEGKGRPEGWRPDVHEGSSE